MDELFPDATPQPPKTGYRVLARKYRPSTFDDLIGQEAMVRTLANAFAAERIHQAYILTGVRGVGKTTTARILARAFNYELPGKISAPSIEMPELGLHCEAIIESRHVDVIEMDAASHTGIDDVREIIENARYRPISARTKVYIIDEVHMLSKQAFNGLLKTLEEPPGHVKFLFATTEVDKLPVTVLSRCQRFDLRRIETPMLAQHFAMICEKEAVSADPEALALIAAAAEGSVRDGLSILDQAISHADLASDSEGVTHITGAQVRDMLGLADKAMQRRLFATVLAGDGAGLIAEIAGQFSLGVEPLALMRAQLDLVHKVTLAQVTGSADAPGAEERAEIETLAKALGAAQLHRLWQLVMKGHDEVRVAPDPLAAAQMALLRVMHASDMPDPGGLVKRIEGLLREGAATAPVAAAASTGGAPVAAAVRSPQAMMADWTALVERVEAVSPLTSSTMRLGVRVIQLSPGTLTYELAPGMPGDPSTDIRRAIETATGASWLVERRQGQGDAQPSLEELRAADADAAEAAMHDDPLVKAVMAAFPGARIMDEASPGDAATKPWSKRA